MFVQEERVDCISLAPPARRCCSSLRRFLMRMSFKVRCTLRRSCSSL